jgi:hypothetical protein
MKRGYSHFKMENLFFDPVNWCPTCRNLNLFVLIWKAGFRKFY